MRNHYPLQWPDRTPRTKPADRRRSRFGGNAARGQVSPYDAAKELLRELELLGAVDVTITSLLPTRHDGLPYSDGQSEDPGVAVWFELEGKEKVFACDCWTTHGENLRAIALSIGAIRGLERWGMAGAVERAVSGFAALPPGGDPEPAKRHWREVLGGTWPELEPAELLAIAKARHRALITKAHPDAGGSTAAAAEINDALAEAERELGGNI